MQKTIPKDSAATRPRRIIRRLAISTTTVLISVYIGFSLLLYFLQDSFLYFPTPDVERPEYTSFRLNSNGETIKIWVSNPGRTSALIYFGGNAEPVDINIPGFSKLLPDHTVYFINYRGYGGSTGKPSEDALKTDALNIYDHVAKQHKAISAAGRSLGSGMAAHIAANRNTDKLLLITPYDSIENVAKTHYPLFPISLLLRDHYNSAKLAPLITARTLLLVAKNDRIIPAKHAHQLAAAFQPGTASIQVIPNEGHNTISSNPDYLKALSRFFISPTE